MPAARGAASGAASLPPPRRAGGCAPLAPRLPTCPARRPQAPPPGPPLFRQVTALNSGTADGTVYKAGLWMVPYDPAIPYMWHYTEDVIQGAFGHQSR